MKNTTCKHENCNNTVRARGMCWAHYMQMYRANELKDLRRSPGTGEWQSWLTTAKGYVIRKRTNPVTGKQEQQWQHRVVMEEHLGRPLRNIENVHHINGVRNDNRFENLELWVTKQPLGQRPADLVDWAKEILALYGAEV